MKRKLIMSMFTLLQENGGDLSDHDLAHLADWANDNKSAILNPHWKRAYALIREGADLLLRRRAMSRADVNAKFPVQAQTPDYKDLREALNDYQTVFYGPHACGQCGMLIVKAAIEQGGKEYEANDLKSARVHECWMPAPTLPSPSKPACPPTI